MHRDEQIELTLKLISERMTCSEEHVVIPKDVIKNIIETIISLEKENSQLKNDLENCHRSYGGLIALANKGYEITRT